MEKNSLLKGKVLLLSAIFFILAPFSTSIPCIRLGVPRIIPTLMSLSMSTIPFFVFVMLLSIYAYLKEGKDRAKIVFLEAIILNVLVLFFKYLFNRPRPVVTGTPGYPSGHSARATWLALKVWKRNKLLGIATWIYAISVMWSRVELCMHYPLDVVGGAVLAILVDQVLRG